MCTLFRVATYRLGSTWGLAKSRLKQFGALFLTANINVLRYQLSLTFESDLLSASSKETQSREL